MIGRLLIFIIRLTDVRFGLHFIGPQDFSHCGPLCL
jgi:hypothetical protein